MTVNVASIEAIRRHPVYRKAVLERAQQKAGARTAVLWQPNQDHEDGTPNPQRLALESEADEVFYGGAAGGGKTDLLLGAALTQHKRAAIFRRMYPLLDSIEQRLMGIAGRENYNQSRRIYQKDDCRIELESCQREGDKFKQQGRPRDLYGFDEITEFSKTIYQFVIGWNRSEDPNQRCRVIAAGNPPMDDAGGWVITEWGPWLDPDHPHKAKPGELRWYYYDDNDNPIWLDTPEPVEVNGRFVTPKSRTFIPASLQDNPHYGDDYLSRVNSMPEPIRSALLGDFYAAKKADPWQVIPTAWVKAAQYRWMEREKPDMPLSGVGVDLARGGADSFVLCKRYGTWFDEPVKVPGVNVEDGPAAAGLMFHALENERHIGYINMDVIGIGSSPYDSAKVMWEGKVNAINVAETSRYVSMSKTDPPAPLFKMRNVRAEMHWRLREALDPEYGSDVALPPGNEILADLCAAKYKVEAGGVIKIEPKDDIKDRIGRSPDVGEAIMLAWLDIDTGASWSDLRGLGKVENYSNRWG